MVSEAEQRRSSSQLLKRTNDRKVLCILYLSTMAATSIAVSVQAMDETKNGLTWVVQAILLGTLYASSSLLLFGITIYFFVLRNQTFEAARNSTEPVSFVVKYSSHGEPINLYLRIGLAIFALMGVGQSGVRISQVFTQTTVRWPEIYKITFELLFFICQTTFILFYHRIVIIDSQELFGASLIHTLGTNLCMWADVTVEKIQSTLHLTGSLSSNDENNATSNHSATEGASSVRAHISFYLLPAVSEYSLLSAALLYEIIKRIGEPSYIELKEGEGHAKRSAKALAKNAATIIKSGYWAPLVIITVIVILTIVTGVTPVNSPSYWKCAILFTEEMVLYCTGIFVTLAAFLKLRHLKFSISLRPKNIDEFQLYIAFTFTVVYITATVALTSYLLRDLDYPDKVQDLLMGRVALDVLELFEVVLQTYLIQDCFRRCSEEEVQRKSKPGRQLIAVLLGINLACWVVKSFQLKEADILYAITENAPYAWVLLAIAMPVYLFYRYHCTVCLSEAFVVVYEDETSRFESLWRQHPVYLAKLLSHPNLASVRKPSMDMNEMVGELEAHSPNQAAQHKVSATNFRIRNEFGRHASFFHPQAINLRQFSSLSVANSQLDLSEPLSQTEPWYRTRLPHSDSHEGPNYFLHKERRQNYASHHEDSAFFPNADGTADLDAYGITQSTNPTASRQFTHYPKHYSQHKLFHSHLPHSTASQVHPTLANQAKDSSEDIPRRPTLVNLQDAKDRLRAKENAHKRVLENASGDYAASINTSKPSKGRTEASRKAARADGDALVSQTDAPKSKKRQSKSTVETPESHLLPSDPPVWSAEDMTASDARTRPITPLRHLEPSLVLHRVMASNLSQIRNSSLPVDVQDDSNPKESERSAIREEVVSGLSSSTIGSPSSPPPLDLL